MAVGQPVPPEGRAELGSDADEARLASRVLAAQVQLVYDLAPRALAASMAVASLAAFFFHSRDHPLATPLWWLPWPRCRRNATDWSAAFARPARSPRPPLIGRARPCWAVWPRGCSGLLRRGARPSVGRRELPARGLPDRGHSGSRALSRELPLAQRLPRAAAPDPEARPAKLVFFHEGQLYPLLGGVAALIYALVLAAIGRTVNRRVVESFELRFRNLDLVQRLSGTNQELQSQIARREQDERALLQARDTAEAANREKSGFLAKMSHEIRTPMTASRYHRALLPSPPSRRGLRRDHGRAAPTLMRLIDDVLESPASRPARRWSQRPSTCAVGRRGARRARQRADKGGLCSR